jgi:hypothetical protein
MFYILGFCFGYEKLRPDPFWTTFNELDWEYWPPKDGKRTGKFLNPFYQTPERSVASYTIAFFYVMVLYHLLVNAEKLVTSFFV